MSKHIPGRWEYLPDQHDGTCAALVAKSCFVAEFSDGPSEADARLIAAAPDLLAALQACDEAMAYMSEYDIPIMLPAQVKAAIKKATGEK